MSIYSDKTEFYKELQATYDSWCTSDKPAMAAAGRLLSKIGVLMHIWQQDEIPRGMTNQLFMEVWNQIWTSHLASTLKGCPESEWQHAYFVQVCQLMQMLRQRFRDEDKVDSPMLAPDAVKATDDLLKRIMGEGWKG